MGWVAENRALTQAEMENNADIIIAYYRSMQYADKTIASILGNMEAESSLSPVRTQIRWWWLWVSPMGSEIKT